MSRTPSRVDEQLAASVRRIGDALEQNRSQHAMVDEVLAATAALGARDATGAEPASGIADRPRRREEHEQPRREERRPQRERSREKRQKEGEAEADLARAMVQAAVAIVCVIFALLRPDFFWMIFVGLGFGTSAAGAFGRARHRRRLEREAHAGEETASASESRPAEAAIAEGTAPPPTAREAADPKVARIQLLCESLLAELESGPAIVREVVTEPHSTIAGLRQACVETARRERELRTVLAGQDEARLVSERDALASRLSAEQDPIVRDRLGQALAALEQQLVHRAALATTASRLEAENTRILYTLENVHLQLLRARSTDIGAPELGGKLRDSLRELGTQIDAVAEALEWADAPVAAVTATGAVRQPSEEVSAGVMPASPAATGATTEAAASDPQRVEREAAARRAAQAREAQRR